MTYRDIQKEKNENALPKRRTQNLTSLLGIANKVLIGLIMVTGLYFVLSINDLAIKGFILSDLKKDMSVLAKENKDLELSIMNYEAYENIEKKAQDLKLVKVDEIDYITVTDSSMAKR